MDTKDRFLQFWFEGVNDYIEKENDKEVNRFLKRCAKSCSDSYSLKIYQEAFANESFSLKESLDILKDSFSDFEYKIFSDKIEIIYKNCGCDLVRENLIKSSRLCRCSELSLKYNWENMFGKNNVKIDRMSSVLESDETCVFEVRLKQLGHIT